MAELTPRELDPRWWRRAVERRDRAALVISTATAKTHVSRILGKLEARDRAQLVVMAYEAGVVTPGRLVG